MISDDELPLFSERPDWADVVPLEQYENINPLAPIFYTEECASTSLYEGPILQCTNTLYRQGCHKLFPCNREVWRKEL